MIRLIYDAPARHILLEDGQTVHGGEEFAVTEERAAQLLADTTVAVHETGDTLSRLTRPELDDVAREAGVEGPELLPNKSAVIAAIKSQREAGLCGGAHLTTHQEV